MEPEYNPQPKQNPMNDIHPHVSSLEHHRSRKILLVSSVVLVILAIVLIALYAKQHRDYINYIKTPEGQLEWLSQNSQPVTKSREEQALELNMLAKNTPQASQTSAQSQLQQVQRLQQSQ